MSKGSKRAVLDQPHKARGGLGEWRRRLDRPPAAAPCSVSSAEAAVGERVGREVGRVLRDVFEHRRQRVDVGRASRVADDDQRPPPPTGRLAPARRRAEAARRLRGWIPPPPKMPPPKAPPKSPRPKPKAPGGGGRRRRRRRPTTRPMTGAATTGAVPMGESGSAPSARPDATTAKASAARTPDPSPPRAVR